MYATQDEIEIRYPMALEQAGPRDSDGNLDEDAIQYALLFADDAINEAFALANLEYTAPYPEFIIAMAVDIALYRATPTVLVESFLDRKTRADDAIKRLKSISIGESLPPVPPIESDIAGEVSNVSFSYKPRRWGINE